MFRSRFLWKLYAGYAVMILLSTVIIGSFVGRRMVQDSLRETRRNLHTQALVSRDLAASILASATGEQAQQSLQSLGAASGTRFTVIRADGTVAADTAEDPLRMDNHATRPEIAAARSQEFGTATRISHTLGMRMMYVALPIHRGAELHGFIRTALPLTVVDERLHHLRTMVLLGAGIAAVVGLPLGFVLARRVTRPLTEMTTTAALMAGEHYDQIVRTRSTDETGELAKAFNRMAYRLRERMEALNKERNQLLAVLGSMIEGVIAVDLDERIVHMNHAAGTILHASAEASLDRRLWEVTRVPAILETTATILRGSETITLETRIMEQRRDQVIAIHATPLWNHKSEVAGAVVVLHDITELRRLERIRREFVANVSHELKTPVTAIKGFIETLRESALDDREQAEHFLDIVARHADRLHAIIEDLLSLSRLEQGSGTSELQRSEEVLAGVLQNAVQDCAIKAEARQVALNVACDPTLRAQLNAPLVRQAVVNLLDNAINYSKEGGTVWLEASRDGQEVAVRVRDEGVGIPREHLPRIFERFYRVDKARSREHGGTGLGLAIVKHIALAHGGRVSVTSTVGRGSTFTMYLPMT
jgi:two-component system phosphate regulon sensor histidine kinase PhoR